MTEQRILELEWIGSCGGPQRIGSCGGPQGIGSCEGPQGIGSCAMITHILKGQRKTANNFPNKFV